MASDAAKICFPGVVGTSVTVETHLGEPVCLRKDSREFRGQREFVGSEGRVGLGMSQDLELGEVRRNSSPALAASREADPPSYL